MFGILVIALLVGLLALFVLVAIAFLEVAFADRHGTRASPLRKWQPPLVTGDQLLTWAASVARATASKQLLAPRTKHTAKQLANAIYKGSAYAISQSPDSVAQPKPNCPSCRNRMIGVTAPEALAIADEIRRTRPKLEARRIRNRAAENAEAVASLDHEQYEQAHIVCPLLGKDDSCVAFDARPLHCRGWCLFSGEDGDHCLLAVSDVGSLDSHAYTVGRGAEDGLSESLESAGLDGNVYELNSALSTALDKADAAWQWAAGKPVFAGCTPARIGDLHALPD